MPDKKVCDHELIVVTRTTVYGEVKVEIEQWVQCKFCENILPQPFGKGSAIRKVLYLKE